jgi:hypothetical protein
LEYNITSQSTPLKKIKGAATIEKHKIQKIHDMKQDAISEIRNNLVRYKKGLDDITERQQRLKNLYNKRIIQAIKSLAHTTLKPQPKLKYEKDNYQIARSNLVKETINEHRNMYEKILKTVRAEDD